jgi:general L-amino acid transport system substrate-binding protein
MMRRANRAQAPKCREEFALHNSALPPTRSSASLHWQDNRGMIAMQQIGVWLRRNFSATTLAAALLLAGLPAHAQGLNFPGPTVEAIKKRGMLVCGIDVGVPGFASQDNTGKWNGLDISYCRAIAAALNTDPEKIRYVPTTAAARFTVLQSGEIDVLIRDSTLTFTRNNQLGLEEIAVNFYAGEGFLVNKKLGVSKIADLTGATICVVTGATLELNIADFARSHGTKIGTLLFDKADEAVQAMEAGRCDGYTDDTGSLAGMRSTLKNPDDWVVLDGVISKEPMGLHARAGDPAWNRILFWVHNALLSAEEFGVTKANADQLKASSNDPFIRRLLGAEGGFGKLMGLDDEWALRAVKVSGNYGEIYDEYWGPKGLNLPRGLNSLWTKGGLQYALPFR